MARSAKPRQEGLIQQWIEAEEWARLAEYLSSLQRRTVDQEYLLGLSLARLDRLDEAESIFLTGSQETPDDPRFPLGLAGVEFKRRRLSKAEDWLRKVSKKGTDADYINDFLGTIYYLRDNLEGALKYWNRLHKPELSAIRFQPTPTLDPFLLDRLFTYSRNERLTLEEFRATRQRIESTRIFSRTRFQLLPVDETRYELRLLSTPRRGINHGGQAALFTLVKELPFETVRFDLYNPWKRTTVWENFYRWDGSRQRFFSRFSRRLARAPQWGYWILFDLRSEFWSLNPAFAGPDPGTFEFEKIGASTGFQYLARDDWEWRSEFELTWRDFDQVDTGLPRFQDGALLRYDTEVRHALWRRPEEGLEVNVFWKAGLGSVPADDNGLFAVVEGGASFQSFLDRSEHEWKVTADFRAGRIGAGAPFDQLFMLGLDRDNNLWLRGHSVTKQGRKGNAPLGNQYLLLSLGMIRPLWENGLISLELGPFLDAGRIKDVAGELARGEWLVDAGAQLNLRLMGIFLIRFSYGRDLQTGNDLFRVIPGSSPLP